MTGTNCDLIVVITPKHAQSFLYYIHLAYMFRSYTKMHGVSHIKTVTCSHTISRGHI